MAIRKCPCCLSVIPATQTVAYSNDLECPGCKKPLEVSIASRHLATLAGLLAAALVWRLTRSAGGMLGWVLPVVYSFLAFSVVAPLILMSTADLRQKSLELGASGHAPSAAGHGSAAHS